jgi:L-ascorbate metabolism protein UlaG (beta-lactamase superfamily)
MRSHKTCVILLAAIVAAFQLEIAPAAPAPPRARPVDPARLLANVVHLSDNDVRFRTSGGISVFVDPMAGAPDLEARNVRLPDPNLILITHPHLDHYNVVVLRDYARRNPRLVVAGPGDVAAYAWASGVAVTVVKPAQDYTLGGVSFHTVPAYYLEGTDHPRERGWVGYVLRLDGATYYVPGDTQPLPEMAEVKADVLFPSVFGCGSNIEQALEMVRLCAPRLVVPVQTSGHDDIVRAFLATLPHGVQGAYYADAKLIVTRRPASQ